MKSRDYSGLYSPLIATCGGLLRLCRLLPLLLLAVMVGGCAGQVLPELPDETWLVSPLEPQQNLAEQQKSQQIEGIGDLPSISAKACWQFYQGLAQTSQRLQIQDSLQQPLGHWPHLRSNRYLVHIARRLQQQHLAGTIEAEAMAAWLAYSNQLANRALLRQWQRWPSSDKLAMEVSVVDLTQRLQHCGQRLQMALLRHPQHWPDLLRAAQWRGDYRRWQRWLGVYPLSRLFLAQGVKGEWQHWQQASAAFESASAIGWQAWQPELGSSMTPLAAVAVDPIGIAQWQPGQQQQWLARFAPDIRLSPALHQVEDRWGKMVWRAGELDLDSQQPTLYTYISYGELHGEPLIQLNYSLWFAKRPPMFALDWVAGRWDGLIWRVHLRPNGELVALDSIHHCGCWYRLWTDWDANWHGDGLSEPILHQPLSADIARRGAVLWIEADSHQLLLVQPRAKSPALSSNPYRLAPYTQLHQLPADGKIRSVFADDGLLTGSERFERWFLWVSGVYSTGTQRTHGRHAIGFLQPTHFDEPLLLQQFWQQWRNLAPTGGAPLGTD